MKNILLALLFSLSLTTATVADVPTTIEAPIVAVVCDNGGPPWEVGKPQFEELLDGEIFVGAYDNVSNFVAIYDVRGVVGAENEFLVLIFTAKEHCYVDIFFLSESDVHDKYGVLLVQK